MKIRDKRKFITRIIILGLIVLFIAMLSHSTYSKVEYKTKSIYVASGETLWSIASEELESNSYYSGKNIQDVLQHIKYLNNLDNCYIYEGQKLDIPTL